MSLEIKTYRELIKLPDKKSRYEYLKHTNNIGFETFGRGNRYLNQKFYTSVEWKHFRNKIILRDSGCDMALKDIPISGSIIVHHIVPLTIDDMINNSNMLFNPNNVVCVSDITHKAIHYGDYSLIDNDIISRSKWDTCPWR